MNPDQKWFRDQIRAAEDSIALMAKIRRGIKDWETEELIREIIFEEIQFIEKMKEDAEHESAGREKLARV